MSAADAACYVAKDRGRNRVHEYEQDDTLVAERYGEMQWIHRIHRAFEDRRFRLYYQSIQPLSDGGATRARAALRGLPAHAGRQRQADRADGLHRRRRALPPDDRHRPLGGAHLVPRPRRGAAARGARGRSLRHQPLGAVAVRGELPALRARGAVASGVDSRRICFEITETAAICKLDERHRLHRGAQGEGLPLRARRLRQRPLLLRLPARPAGRLPEDRRRVRAQHGRRPRQARAWSSRSTRSAT